MVVYQLLGALRLYPEIDLRVVLLNEGKLASELRGLGIPVTVIPENGTSFLRICRLLRDFLRDEHVDVVHSHRYKENILSWVATLVAMNVSLISTQHGMPEIPRDRRCWKNVLFSRLNLLILSRYFDRLVAVSSDMRNKLTRSLGFPENKVSVIRNGFSANNLSPTRNIRQNIVIGSAGRLVPIKDYPLMIGIAQSLTSTVPGIRFELAGEGPDRAALEELIRSNGIGDVFRLRGGLDHMDSFYRGLDIYLNTSAHEGIPMSILEAMGMGLPVVAPAVGGISEVIVDGVSGYLVDGREPEHFADRCLRLIRDRALREKIGGAARERVIRNFSVETMASEYRDLYFQIARPSAFPQE